MRTMVPESVPFSKGVFAGSARKGWPLRIPGHKGGLLSRFSLPEGPQHRPSFGQEAMTSSGQPLDPHTRELMESRFGHDFSQVAVHANAGATEAASAISARAFTVGHDIVFGAGEYVPSSFAGRNLLAHELTHVVQQRTGIRLTDGMGQSDDAYEVQAEAVAARVANGTSASSLLARVSPVSGTGDAGRRKTISPFPASTQVQRQPLPRTQEHRLDLPLLLDAKKFAEWDLLHAIKEPIAEKLAHEFVNRGKPAQKVSEQPSWSGGKGAGEPYVWQPGRAAPVPSLPAVGTYVEGNPTPPHPPPTEEQVSGAIYRALDKIKMGKGDKLEDWSWKESPEWRAKTRSEKETEVTNWGLEQAQDKIRESAEERLLGATVKDIAIEWFAVDVLGATVAVASGAAEIAGALELLLSVAELAASLQGPAELEPWQSEDARIVAEVRAYLQGKEEAAEFRKRLWKPVIEISPAVRDETDAVIFPR